MNSLTNAAERQRSLAARIITAGRPRNVKTVAGLDAGYCGNIIRAAAALLSFPELNLLDKAVAEGRVMHQYTPGFFSLREAPALLKALQRLKVRPDLIFVDGHGLAHPRRFGLACEIGLESGIPTIGAAKSRLIGSYSEPQLKQGEYSLLFDGNEIVGAVLRTREGVRPVFVSVGNLLDLESAISYSFACCRGFRLPEPLKAAHASARP